VHRSWDRNLKFTCPSDGRIHSRSRIERREGITACDDARGLTSPRPSLASLASPASPAVADEDENDAYRYHMVMARTQTLVQLTEDLVAMLDEEAAERGLSRSALIRDVLTTHLEARREAVLSRRILEGYERIPPGEPDGWADIDELSDLAATDLGRRLHEEERREGHGPW
jgi:hypothetical protein